MNIKDVEISEKAPKTLLINKHIDFLTSYKHKQEYEYHMSEYLRLSGVYWSLTALQLMKKKEEDSLVSPAFDKEEVLDFILKCLDPCGGFGASVGHDPHILYTLSAIQVLCLYNELERIDLNHTSKYILNLQQEDGSFYGDKWGEVDTRFSFCAVASLALMNKLDLLDKEKTLSFVLSCMNFDSGFGSRPSSESHSGQIYCCLGVLSILGCLETVDKDALGWWLCERQLQSGGLNGRPEKKPDVCYSWWVLASLCIIQRIHWIDKKKLIEFILASQDEETGGFADRPGDIPDPFHTLFGLAGLSLLGYEGLVPINQVFCMPQNVVEKYYKKN